MVDTAIILAGGLGTRLRPLTLETPKPLLPIKEKPIVQHALENLARFGVKRAILSVGYKAEQIQEYFDQLDLGIKISYCVEKELLGTGGAIKLAADGLAEPFFLLWGDNLMDLDLQGLSSAYLEGGAPVCMVLTEREDTENFGVVQLEGNRAVSFVEKPKREEAPSNLINAGAFVVDPEILRMLPPGKSSIEKDCFEKIAAGGKISAYVHRGQWFPTDNLEKYELANNNFEPIKFK